MKITQQHPRVKQLHMKNEIDDIDEIDWCDYPYIGIGKKPISNKKQASCEQIEKIIGG